MKIPGLSSKIYPYIPILIKHNNTCITDSIEKKYPEMAISLSAASLVARAAWRGCRVASGVSHTFTAQTYPSAFYCYLTFYRGIQNILFSSNIKRLTVKQRKAL
jgi:hypothetical protein